MLKWTNKNVKPLSDKAVAEMRFIMDGILEGRLKHNQKAWHCGTAHCFMGWAMVLLRSAERNKKSIFTTSVRKDVSSVCSHGYGYSDMDGFIMNRWGITWNEWSKIADSDNTKGQLNSYIKRLENGYRYTSI